MVATTEGTKSLEIRGLGPSSQGAGAAVSLRVVPQLTSLLHGGCMYFSRFNLFSKLRDSENYFIVNLLSGNADILGPAEAQGVIEGRFPNRQEFVEKGYLVEKDQEEHSYRMKYLDFLDKRDSGEIQIFFVPTYACNFSCSYCYQNKYSAEQGRLTRDVIDSFYRYIDSEFADRDKYITIFGGEPLLPDHNSKENIKELIQGANRRGMDIAVVTNGYHLDEYVPVLDEGSIREIQVTLDGIEDIHNSRRPLRNGEATFCKIVQGIDRLLEGGYTVNLRVVLDNNNIDELPALARFASERGWTDNTGFKTQLGRNYELHTCQVDGGKLFSRAAFYDRLYNLVQAHPEVSEFHRPAFSLSRFLFENGELPEPLFDSCPACKTEWAFDYTGRIYSCTATVGKQDECLGTFHPELTRKEEIIQNWQERDVTSIPECTSCSLQLTCGGGCGSVAKNRTGSIHTPDCRPEKDLMEMGISLYFEKGLFDGRENNVHQCCTI